jgi:hypothetical protein
MTREDGKLAAEPMKNTEVQVITILRDALFLQIYLEFLAVGGMEAFWKHFSVWFRKPRRMKMIDFMLVINYCLVPIDQATLRKSL